MLLKGLIFFAGKGGVGKSTLSCAVALRLSEIEKTLLVSVDPAHSLSGILGIQIGPVIRAINDNLYAIELSAQELVEKYTKRVISALGDFLPNVKAGLKEYSQYIKHSPTALETVVLDHLLDLSQDYAYIVIDSAPTGQMLRLFETAHMVSGWFNFLSRLAKERQKVQTFMGKEDDFHKIIEERKQRIENLLNLLREKGIIFAIANEEPLSLKEAQDIQEALRDMKVYKVINRCKSMEGDFIKIPSLESPYGIENLKNLKVEPLLEFIVYKAIS